MRLSLAPTSQHPWFCLEGVPGRDARRGLEHGRQNSKSEPWENPQRSQPPSSVDASMRALTSPRRRGSSGCRHTLRLRVLATDPSQTRDYHPLGPKACIEDGQQAQCTGSAAVSRAYSMLRFPRPCCPHINVAELTSNEHQERGLPHSVHAVVFNELVTAQRAIDAHKSSVQHVLCSRLSCSHGSSRTVRGMAAWGSQSALLGPCMPRCL